MEFSTNASSIKTQANDAFTETIKMIEDDYYEFNEIVNKNLRIENDIEKQLEKEDKKCTFLKHTIASLKKKLEGTERLRTEQRNYIFDLQMEIEQISSTIYEEMEEKRIAYPEEDAKPYREMVNVVQRMVDYISNFKTVIQENIDDCVDRGVETEYWKNTSEQLIYHILELRITKDRLRSEIDRMLSYLNDRSLEDINKNIENLQKMHVEFKNKTISHQEHVSEKNKLDIWKQQIIAKSADKKTSWLSTEKQYEQLKKSSTDDIISLRTEISSTIQQYYDLMNETKPSLDSIEKGLDDCECLIQNRSVVLEDMNRKEIALEYKDETITSSIGKLENELSQLQESNEILEKQEQFAKEMYTSMQFRTETLKASISENEINLKNLQEELMKVTNYSTSSLTNFDKSNDTSESTLRIDLDNMKQQNDKLEKEHNKLEQEARDLQIVEDELELKLRASDAEIDFLNLLHNEVSVKIDEEKQKVNKKINEKIGKCIENLTELNNIVFEKDLLLDIVRADVQKCFSSISRLNSEIKAQTKENREKKTKLSQMEETFNNEEKILQNKAKLLEDLEKNTFPKNKIPTEWVQSLQQQKNEYEKLKAERLELEEQRNNLKAAKKNLAEKKGELEFSDKCSDTESKKQSPDLEMKSAAYKMFKERIMKRSGNTLFG